MRQILVNFERKTSRCLGDYSLRKFLIFSANPIRWPSLVKLRVHKISEIKRFSCALNKYNAMAEPIGTVRHFVFRNWIVGKPAYQCPKPFLPLLLEGVDPELRMRADRLSWAIELAAYDQAFAWDEIESWFALRANALDLHKDSYSASERISNLIMLLNIATPNEHLKGSVESLIVDDADRVIRNPEYHGELNTNNHILNNARSLILAGSFLDSKRLFGAGCWIFRSQFDKHINDDGLLREGSSHYQHVVTRWVVDIACALFYRDRNYFEQIQSKLDRMLDVCDIMARSESGNWYLPTIGDISPDFPPRFYRGFTAFGRKISFAGRNEFKKNLDAVASNEGFWGGYFGGEQASACSHEWLAADGSWASFKYGPWALLTHTDTAFQDPRPTHGHHDLFSFELSAFGVPFIVDPGRSNYAALRDDQEAGILEEWHNTVMIGRARTGFVPRGYMPAKWLKSVRPEPRVEVRATELKISIASIPTLRSRVAVERCFSAVGGNELRIRTRLSNLDLEELPVRQVLHVAGELQIDGNRATLQLLGRRISLSWKNLEAPTACKAVRYIEYAKGVPCTRLEWSSKATTQHWESEFHITVNEVAK